MIYLFSITQFWPHLDDSLARSSRIDAHSTQLYAPCTLNPESTWMRIPVILVFLARYTNAFAQSSSSVSCLSTAISFAAWMRSSEYFLPWQTVSRYHTKIHTRHSWVVEKGIIGGVERKDGMGRKGVGRSGVEWSGVAYPFRKKKTWKNRVDANLRPDRHSKALDEL